MGQIRKLDEILSNKKSDAYINISYVSELSYEERMAELKKFRLSLRDRYEKRKQLINGSGKR